MNSSITSDPATLTVIRPPVFVTGQWDFLQGNLAPTCGSALQYYDAGAHTITDFGTTTHYGIPNINGVPTSVMHFNPTSSETGGYTLSHGAATPVNAYTLIYDVYYPAGWILPGEPCGHWTTTTKACGSTIPTTLAPNFMRAMALSLPAGTGWRSPST